jgi:hypothetical protein
LNTDFENRHTLFNDFDRLLATIRKLQGFEEFLLAPSESELKTLATSGPIVVFNVSEIRSDAFIVNPTDIRFVPLPSLEIADLESYSNMFLNAIRRHSSRDHAEARGEMHNVLVWLWNVAISPILDELGRLLEQCSLV